MHALVKIVVGRRLSVGGVRCFSQSPGMSVFSWGSGDEGQLGQEEIIKAGLTNTYVEESPKEIKGLNGVGVTDISCGFTHAAAVTTSGQVLTWGSYSKSKLGHVGVDGAKHCLQPTAVGGIAEVSGVTCGEKHTAALTKDGELFTWGSGGSLLRGPGALGHGDTATAENPTKVTIAGGADVRLSAISSGKSHMLGEWCGFVVPCIYHFRSWF